MRKLLLCAALTAFTLTAGAQTFKLTNKKADAAALNARTPQTFNAFRLAKGNVTAKEAEEADTQGLLKYGTKEEVMLEDFSKLNTGSVGNPDRNTKLDREEYEYPWINMDDDYTLTPGWGCFNAFPAGGAICIDTSKKGEYGHINTPMLNVGKYDCIAVLTFKARTDEGVKVSDFMVEGAETFNMAPTWRFLENYTCPTITDEWQEFTFIFHNCGEYTLFNLVPAGNYRLYLDDIEVYTINPYVAMPHTKAHTNYQGTSFDANWEAVEGADSYLVNLYDLDDLLGQERLLQSDLAAQSNTYHFDGMESGRTYFYSVRAVKGEHVSFESTKQTVFDLVAPVLNPTDFGTEELEAYSAGWSEVPSAEYYNYWAMSNRVAKEDGPFVVMKDDFSNLKNFNGSDPTYTVEEHEWNVYGETFIVGMEQAGWKGENYVPYADGYAVVDAYHYLYNQENSGIISPELDLSKDGGKITVDLSLMGELCAFWDVEGTKHEGVVQCAVALFNFNEETGDFSQVELAYAGDVTEEVKDFTVTLTKGSARSKVGIFGVGFPGNLYIDAVKISQNYKAGESLLDPFFFNPVNPVNMNEVPLPNRLYGQEIYHKVCAGKSVNVEGVEGSLKESAYSATEKVNVVVSSINGLGETVPVSLRLNGSTLQVENAGNSMVEVFNANGTLVAKGKQGAFNLGTSGVYLVKVGNQVTKFAF